MKPRGWQQCQPFFLNAIGMEGIRESLVTGCGLHVTGGVTNFIK